MAEYNVRPDADTGFEIVNMDASRLCDFAAKLCAEIYAQSGGTYRGGIYPENISIAENGDVSIGAAKSMDWDEEELRFIAPELYWHGQGSPAGDVYSVGLLLYYAVSGGKLPFEDAGDAQLRRMGGENFPAPNGTWRRLSEIIEKATRFNASERYQSVEELRLMLEGCEKNIYIDSDKGASAVFNKAENQLSDIERMMISIMEGKNGPETKETDNTPPEESAEEVLEEIPEVEAEEETPVEEAEAPKEEDKLPEDLMALFAAEEEKAEESPAEEPAQEEEEKAEAEENPVAEESEAEEEAKEEPASEENLQEDTQREPIPILTVEENPELEPVMVRTPIIPAVQYTKSIERERKIAEEVKKRRRRPMMFILICCAMLIVIAIIANAVMNDISEKNQPKATPVPTPVATPTPKVTPKPTPKVSTYQIIVEDVTWTQARARCIEMGGHLAVIGDMAEYDTIVKLAQLQNADYLWIGCHREGEEYVWETDDEISYLPWADGEPSKIDTYDGASEDYIMLWNNDGWYLNDSRNDPVGSYQWYSGNIGYICEFE